MMTKFFTVLATTAAALTLTAAPTPVQAADVCQVYEGHTLCVTLGHGQDYVTIDGPQYRESGTVVCRNYVALDWQSRGNMTQAEADAFFTGYCEGRGTT